MLAYLIAVFCLLSSMFSGLHFDELHNFLWVGSGLLDRYWFLRLSTTAQAQPLMLKVHCFYFLASGVSKVGSGGKIGHSSNLSSPIVSTSSVKSNNQSLPTARSEDEILSCPGLKAFTFNDLKTATKNFRPDSLIGEGGFGYVFKGWIDEQTLCPARPGSGMVIAVKKLKPEGFQGHKEWLVSFSTFLIRSLVILVFLACFLIAA